MKKIYFLKKIRGVFQSSLLLLLLISVFSAKINAQTYVNGNLSTGATSSTGTAAPAGFTWSEVQLGNVNAGFGANIAANLTIADDFTVPAGLPWTVTKVTFYAYSTGWAGTTSPFNDTRVQIYNTDPSVGTPAPIYGDLTTNRFASSTSANMYRIFNATPGTTRQIWKIEANVSTTLAPGTYWIEWQHGLTGATSNFSPASTVLGSATVAGYNAKQHDVAAGTWINLVDGTNAMDMPFRIDYTTNLCTGTPAPGNTVASSTSICAGLSVNLSLQNATTGSGVIYQWQSSPTLAGPYTDIVGATNSTYSSSQTVGTYYQATVTCSGNTGTSTPVFVDMTPQANCYCTAGSTNVDPTFEKIANVTFGTINNSSTSLIGYEDFSSLTPVASFEAGSTVPFTITGNANTYPGDVVRIWIDYNQNGNFNDAGELVYESAASAGPYTGNVIFPVTANTGTVKMRIRLYDDTFGNGNNTPCGDNTYGQVEDYLINITPCVTGAIATQPTAMTSNCGGTVVFNVGATGTGLTYQWQESADGGATWTIVNDGGIYSGSTTGTLTLTGVSSSLSGHQFQVSIGGGCTPIFLSSAVTLTVNPLVATVSTPLPVQICSTGGSPQAISITNASGATTTVSIPSMALALAIPEVGVTGINNTINVTTIPAGVSIVGLSVTLNVTHTWVGDLVAVLKAPNGQTINLLTILNGTGGAAPSTGFTNTVISSEGTDPLDDLAASPFTGTYAANLFLNPIIGLPVPYPDPLPVGPTGFLPTTTSWSDLFSTANGGWTLAIYDSYDDSGAPGQPVNLLDNWSINITYGAPATGIFTPSAGLFTDAAGLIPYTGTAVNTVYANPTASTTYSLVVTTPTCASAALDIPVIIADAISGTSTVTSTPACEGGTITLTSSAPTGGTTYGHQWQVSTGGGAFTDLADGGDVDGVNTNTLTLSNLAASMNGNVYRDSIFVTSCNSFVISNTATLTVNALPVTTLVDPTVTSLYPGISSTISVPNPPAGATFQWFLNGVAIPNETSSSINVNVDGLGEYTVEVTSAGGCAALSTNSVTITSAPNTALFIYPNPTNNGIFQVRYYATPGNPIARNVTIFDSKGARVYTRMYNSTQPYSNMGVDISTLSRGIYRVELSDRSGRRIKTGSVIRL
ncbi:MAG: GEVED domain-containing protein [Ferruginibacter sp.]